MSTADCSVLELSFCTETASGYMDCLRSTASSVTYLPRPLLMTTHDRDPLLLTDSISTSMLYLPECGVT